MIASLRGEVVLKSNDGVVIQVGGGMGHEVQMPTRFLGEVQVGQKLFCYTHLVVGKAEWKLFGFKTRQEVEIFKLLLRVQKVGPRVALAALSTMKPHALASAIVRKRADLLSHIPGVGKKMAQRMILDLKGKIDHYARGTVATAGRDDTDAISALMALGYSKAEALAALKEVPGSNLELQEKLWLALQHLNKQRELNNLPI